MFVTGYNLELELIIWIYRRWKKYSHWTITAFDDDPTGQQILGVCIFPLEDDPIRIQIDEPLIRFKDDTFLIWDHSVWLGSVRYDAIGCSS